MNRNVEIRYDHRNLIIFIKHHIIGIKGEITTQIIHYYYDESGNRIRKVIMQSYLRNPVEPVDLDNLEEYPEYDEESFNHAAEEYYNQVDQPGGPGEPEPGNGEGDNPFLVWYVVSNEFYIRGVEGNELVIFNGNNVSKYNFFGSGNEGYIDSDDKKHYYMKDHLGSVRVVLNENNEIVSAQDYDMWGYLMVGRNFDSQQTKYKFTGKERDKESNYDYFGARYYDARIGRWGSIDPILEKHYDFNPYNYVLNNTLRFIDPEGEQVEHSQYANPWYHINKETQHLQQKVNKLEQELKKISVDLLDVVRVTSRVGFNVGRKIIMGQYHQRNIFLWATYTPTIWFVLGTAMVIVFATWKDAGDEKEKIFEKEKEEERKMLESKQKENKKEEESKNDNVPDRLYIEPPRIKWYSIGTTYY
jgi:RHS repeat-associated protein